MDNQRIAQHLLAHARRLEARHDTLYRVRAYRQAAAVLLNLRREASDLLAELGRDGLAQLRGIGPHLAYTIEELIRTGEFRTWDERPRTRRARAG